LSSDLNFKRPYTQPEGGRVELNFSLSDDAPQATAVLRLSKPAPVLRISSEAQKPAVREASMRLQIRTVQSVHVAAAYDNRTFRGPSAAKDDRFRPAAALGRTAGEHFEQSAYLRRIAQDQYQQAELVGAQTNALIRQARNARTEKHQVFEQSAPLHASNLARHDEAVRASAAAVGLWQIARHLIAVERDIWEYPPHLRKAYALGHEQAVAARRRWGEGWERGRFTSEANRIRWQAARQPSSGHEAAPPTEPAKPPYEGTPLLDFVCPWLDFAGDDITLNFRVNPCPSGPEPGQTVVVPVRKVYMVMNDVQLRRVDGDVMLPALSFSMRIDRQSWTWSFEASLPAQALPYVRAYEDGTPVELEAVINGTAYRLLASGISRDRTFGSAALRVSGRGKTAVLDEPIAVKQTFGNAQARTAQQLMADVLTLNGVSIGWEIDWRITDWLVPAGAWSHQGSYISALNTIAAAAGAYIQPHPNQRIIRVLPTYPKAPWDWDAVVPDFELPSDVTRREGIEWVQKPRYNRVYVAGTAQGILAQVTRQGTAGDVEAPMIVDPLITHADAARQRGTTVLGDTGSQALVTLGLPVLAETGIIEPGRFVRYVDEGVIRKGLVLSTAVDSVFPEAWQSIGVETHVG